MRSLYHKNRLREVDADMLITLKEEMSFQWRDVDALLGVSGKQRLNYLSCGRVPADRFYAARDALLLAVEEESREKRDKIMKLFSSTTLT